MKNIQEKVKFFCSNNQLNTAVEYRILDTISELGESEAFHNSITFLKACLI